MCDGFRLLHLSAYSFPGVRRVLCKPPAAERVPRLRYNKVAPVMASSLLCDGRRLYPCRHIPRLLKDTFAGDIAEVGKLKSFRV